MAIEVLQPLDGWRSSFLSASRRTRVGVEDLADEVLDGAEGVDLHLEGHHVAFHRDDALGERHRHELRGRRLGRR
ncbi:MAG: hypothetical protein H6745_08555 [Deltaproteobacteria bacterium]|nr:hypothetical protein [Deltaproteobacteria bacterium]